MKAKFTVTEEDFEKIYALWTIVFFKDIEKYNLNIDEEETKLLFLAERYDKEEIIKVLEYLVMHPRKELKPYQKASPSGLIRFFLVNHPQYLFKD
jgi:hypothetical protein